MTSSSDGGPDPHPADVAAAVDNASTAASAAAAASAPPAAQDPTVDRDAAKMHVEGADAAAASGAPTHDAQPATEPALPTTPKRNGDATVATQQSHVSPAPAGSADITGQPASAGTANADVFMPDAPGSTAAQATPAAQNRSTDVQDQPQQLSQPGPPANMAQFAPSTPLTPAQMANLDPHAYMMMAFASMSGQHGGGMSPPPTVTPSQVTLPNHMDDGFNGNGAITALRQSNVEKGLESFARIEFADSVFQMTTYAVIIGRDQRALEQARRDEKRQEEHQRRVEDNASKGLPPPSPIRNDRSKFSKSYVSEEGGMLGPESDSESNGRPPKRRKTSTTGSSQNEIDESQDNIISDRQYVSHTPGAAAVDLTSLRPSPWHVPFIGIHSPGPDIASKTKAISREHLKISYNQEDGVFEAIPLHKNGFFCEDVHYKSDKVVLRCGDRLQIKDIDFRIIINGVERGKTGAEEEERPRKKTHGGKEMSFDFEGSHGNGEFQDTSDDLSDLKGTPPEMSDDGDDADGFQGEASAGAIKTDPLSGLADPTMSQIPKKRGPGRPPKNGIMSKREQRLLKKQQQELAKKTLPQAPPAEPPIKRKVGRPRKHPLPEDGEDRPEKRKYKPRKPKEDGGEGSDAERRAREKKEKKARPKSPPLELKIEDYTEEQLQKPNKNYGVLIDETLTAAGPDGLTLKQIYKRICQRYPWFYFHTETKGWESSVRHNLIGNEAFKKDETTNLWSRVPGVELDAGKKRKASSPDRALAAQGYGPYSYPYPAAQHMPPGQVPGYPPGQTPAGYQVQGFPGQPGQVPRPAQPYAPAPAQAPGPAPAVPHQHAQAAQPGQPGAVPPPAPTQVPDLPPPAPARAQPGGPQPGAYSSPYASRPPPTLAHTQANTENGAPPPPPAPVIPNPAFGARPGSAARPTTSGPSSALAQSTTPGSRPTATPPTAAPPRPVIEPRLLSAITGLKNGLVDNLRRARNPKAEAIVMSALNRCIGLKTEATENDKMEAICMKGIRQVIEGYNKNKSPTPGGSTSAEAIPAIFEPKVLTSLNGLKGVSVKAIKATVGEARAEAVALSAIDRVLGFADASLVPPPAEGEETINTEGVENHMMQSIKKMLMGMNQKLKDD